jgi:hypothetical protein
MSDAPFLFAGPVWFIGPRPPYHSLNELCRVVLTGLFEDKELGRIKVVYAFSDADLAERFWKKAGTQAAPYVPLCLSDDKETIRFLLELQKNCYQYLSTDTEDEHAVVLPINGVIQQFSQRQSDPATGSGEAP